jgi:DNA-binding MarR family transcriptional regulator
VHRADDAGGEGPAGRGEAGVSTPASAVTGELPAEVLPRHIVELLHELGTHMHGLGARFAEREHLHTTDAQALSHLAMHGGRLTVGALARELDLSTGATTRLVDRLAAVGHVTRIPDPDDRRRRHVAMSETAAAAAGGFFGDLAARIDTVLAGHDEDELRVIAGFLRRVIEETDDTGR